MNRLFIPALILVALPAAACAQKIAKTYQGIDGQTKEEVGTFCPDAYRCATSPRESFPMVSANTASAPVTVFGGDYVFSQTCTSYGTLTFQKRGPDGVTFITMFTKTATDPGNDTGMVLGSYAVVRVVVTGAAGCNAILARVPA